MGLLLSRLRRPECSSMLFNALLPPLAWLLHQGTAQLASAEAVRSNPEKGWNMLKPGRSSMLARASSCRFCRTIPLSYTPSYAPPIPRPSIPPYTPDMLLWGTVVSRCLLPGEAHSSKGSQSHCLEQPSPFLDNGVPCTCTYHSTTNNKNQNQNKNSKNNNNNNNNNNNSNQHVPDLDSG